jgi:hypothetical protein
MVITSTHEHTIHPMDGWMDACDYYYSVVDEPQMS